MIGAVLGGHSTDTVALEESLIRTKTLKEYQEKLSELISSENLRQNYGEKIRNAIEKTHSSAEFWLNNLAQIYSKAFKGSKKRKLNNRDESCFSELDCLIPQIYRTDLQIEQILDSRLKHFSMYERMYVWFKLAISAPHLMSIPLISKILFKLRIMEVYHRSKLAQRLKAYLFQRMRFANRISRNIN